MPNDIPWSSPPACMLGATGSPPLWCAYNWWSPMLSYGIKVVVWSSESTSSPVDLPTEQSTRAPMPCINFDECHAYANVHGAHHSETEL